MENLKEIIICKRCRVKGKAFDAETKLSVGSEITLNDAKHLVAIGRAKPLNTELTTRDEDLPLSEMTVKQINKIAEQFKESLPEGFMTLNKEQKIKALNEIQE